MKHSGRSADGAITAVSSQTTTVATRCSSERLAYSLGCASLRVSIVESDSESDESRPNLEQSPPAAAVLLY